MKGAAIGILGILALFWLFAVIGGLLGGFAPGAGLILMVAGMGWVRYSARRWG